MAITWSDVEEQLRVAAAALGVGAFALQASGYLALRFRVRALGVEPELSLLNEQVLFTGAYLLVFLLTVLPLLLITLAVLALPVCLIRQIKGARHWLDGLWARWRESPRAIALGVGLWAVTTVELVLREILQFHDLLFRPLPCEPIWLRWLSLVEGDELVVLHLFFAGLLILPLPTLWATWRLWGVKGWHGASVVLGALALVQVLSIPIHFGVLVQGSNLPRVASLPEDAGGAPGDRVWEVHRTPDTIYYLVRPAGGVVSNRLIEVKTESQDRPIEIITLDPLYAVLAEGSNCL